jgi:hypothetical protein
MQRHTSDPSTTTQTISHEKHGIAAKKVSPSISLASLPTLNHPPPPARSFSAWPLDRGDIDPEPGVIALVLGVAVDLRLNPLYCAFVRCEILVSPRSIIGPELSDALTVDVRRIRVRQPARTIAMAPKPFVIPIVVLTVPSRSNIGIEIRTVQRQKRAYWLPDVSILQLCPVVVLTCTLSHESST